MAVQNALIFEKFTTTAKEIPYVVKWLYKTFTTFFKKSLQLAIISTSDSYFSDNETPFSSRVSSYIDV